MYGLLSPFGYAAFALVAALPTSDPDRRARRLLGIQRRAFRLMFGWLRLVQLLRFRPGSLAGQVPDGPCVIVANHPTLVDVTAVIASVGAVSTVVKPQLWRLAWLRPLLRASAQLEGADGQPLGAQRVLEEAVGLLGRGWRILVFPEATRSPRGGLGRFRRAAFEIACRADVPVIPLLVRCEPLWLSKDAGFLRPTVGTPTFELAVLPAILPADVGHDSRELRAQLESRYREALSPGPTAGTASAEAS